MSLVYTGESDGLQRSQKNNGRKTTHENSLTPGAVTDQNHQWKGDGTVVGTIVFKTCEYGILHGKRDLADVIERRILRRGDYSEIPRSAQCHQQGSL